MNIAHLLPYSAYFPLKNHNGRYEWVLRLALLQAAKGHTVTIYAAPESGEGLEEIVWKTSPNNLHDKQLNNIALIKTAFQETSHDIYHSHFDYLHYQLADLTTKPVIFTQHWFPNDAVRKAVSVNTTKNVLAVPPTHYMFKENKRLSIPTAETIYHGIDLKLFQPSRRAVTDRLIFVGRIAPSKGVLEAIQIARANNKKLDIVGKVTAANQTYWDQIKPFVDGYQIRHLGAKSQQEVAELLASAKAFLFPSKIPEAFGQTTVEAQACGTPVIISNVGASSELVDDGKSGFVVGSETEFGEALKKVNLIDRGYCRKFAAERFDIKRMAEQYDELYVKLLS